MKYKELREKIKRGKIEPLYLFSGEEDYLKEEALQMIKKILVAPEWEEFDYEVFYGKEVDPYVLSDKARTPPLGSKRRMMVVRNEEQMKKREVLIPYLENPSPFTCLIFTGTKKTKQNRFYSALREDEVIFWPLFESEAVRWVRERVLEKKKKMGREEILYFLETVGNNLSLLSRELEKLFLYSAERERIEKKDIEILSGESWVNSLLVLGDALLKKKRGKSLKALSSLTQEKGEAVKIVYRLTRQFRTLWQVKILLAQGYTPPQARTKLGLKKLYFSNLSQAASLFSERELAEVFESLLQADLKLKTSKEGPKLVLELLVIDICRGSYEDSRARVSSRFLR